MDWQEELRQVKALTSTFMEMNESLDSVLGYLNVTNETVSSSAIVLKAFADILACSHAVLEEMGKGALASCESAPGITSRKLETIDELTETTALTLPQVPAPVPASISAQTHALSPARPICTTSKAVPNPAAIPNPNGAVLRVSRVVSTGAKPGRRLSFQPALRPVRPVSMIKRRTTIARSDWGSPSKFPKAI